MNGAGERRGRPRYPDLLTPAEWRVTDAVRHGLSNSQIARRRGVSVDAVKFHVRNAVDKLGLGSRARLQHWTGIPADSATQTAIRSRLMTPDDHLQLGQLGQVSRTVRDIDTAVNWYGTVLGLTHLFTFGDLAFFDCAGVRLFLSAGAGSTRSDSVLYFQVPDIHRAYEHLLARGVEFLGAPHLIHRHDSGVEEWMAFFNDPDQQPLAIMARTPPQSPATPASGAQ